MGWLSTTYLIDATPDGIGARAEALALEQSVEMALSAVRDPRIRNEVVGRVISIDDAGHGRFRVVVELAVATTGGDVAQLLNMIFGNCSLQDDVELEDVAFPPALLERFSGPHFGIAGLRKLSGVADRALTCTALKPQGSSAAELARLCKTFALGGIDVIKDDHGLADQEYAPFAERVRLCQEAVAQAKEETGKGALYAPSLVGTPRKLAEQGRIAEAAGVKIVLVAPMLIGLPTFYELSCAFPQLAILAHPAFGGAARISPAWLFGRFFRLLGADAVIYPNYGGRFSYSRELCSALAASARAPWGKLEPAFPVPAGGMSLDRIDEMLELYGSDVMLLIGGALLAAGDALLERTREFVGKVAGATNVVAG